MGSPQKLVRIQTYVDKKLAKKIIKKRGKAGLISDSAYLRELIHKDIEVTD